MKSKFFILIAVLLVALLAFSACNGDSGNDVDVTTPGADGGDVTTAPPSSELVNIIVGGATEYKIVRPDLSSDELTDASVALKNAINKKYGVQMSIGTDFEGRNFNVADRHKYEIVVGATNRDESAQIIDSIRYNDFVIAVVGTRVVITGGCEDASVNAVNYFIENYLNEDNLILQSDLRAEVSGNYLRDNVTLNGVPLSEYTIVYSSAFKSVAQAMAHRIGINSGDIISTSGESLYKGDENKMIVISSKKYNADLFGSFGADDFSIVGKDGNICIGGGSDYAISTACERLLDSLFASVGDVNTSSFEIKYTLPDRQEYINDITKLALHWEFNFDVPEWMLDFDEKYRAMLDGNGRLMTCLHRGDMTYYPENSIEGIISTIMMGADMVEIDPRKTKDGVLILLHDTTLERTTNFSELAGKNGLPTSSLVSDWTYEQLMQLNLKEGTGGEDAEVTPYKIPTLDEAFKVCANRIFIRLDVKSDENTGVVFWNFERDIWPMMTKYKSYYNVIYTWHSMFTSSSYKLVKTYMTKQKDLTGKIAPLFIGCGKSTTANSVISLAKSLGSTKTTRLTNFDLKTTPAEDYIAANQGKLKALTEAGFRIYVDAHTGKNESPELFELLYNAGIDIQLVNNGLPLCKYVAENFEPTK